MLIPTKEGGKKGLFRLTFPLKYFQNVGTQSHRVLERENQKNIMKNAYDAEDF